MTQVTRNKKFKHTIDRGVQVQYYATRLVYLCYTLGFRKINKRKAASALFGEADMLVTQSRSHKSDEVVFASLNILHKLSALPILIKKTETETEKFRFHSENMSLKGICIWSIEFPSIKEVFTVSHEIWADLIRIFRLILPAIASQTTQKFSDQICSELPELISSVRSKSNQISIRFWTDLIQHLNILLINYIYCSIIFI